MNYQEMLKSTYAEVVSYLKEKYGEAKYNYFSNESMKSKNAKISRTKEGLVCHHIREIEIMQLSEPKIAQMYDYKYQLAENLVYCNYIEHLILHILIHKENPQNSRSGINIISMNINYLFEKGDENNGWRLDCYNVIKDDIKDYVQILKNDLNRAVYDGVGSTLQLSRYATSVWGLSTISISKKIKDLLRSI